MNLTVEKRLSSTKQLDELIKGCKPFLLTCNSTKGAFIRMIGGWDCKNVVQDCYYLIKAEELGYINLDNGATIICDADGLEKMLEVNDFATYLIGGVAKNYGMPIVGDVIVAFP